MREREGLELIKEVNGHKLYMWPQIEGLSGARYMALMYNIHDSKLGIVRNDLEEYNKRMTEAHNTGNSKQVGFLIETMNFYLEVYPPDKTNFNMANTVILVDDEPVHEMDSYHTKLKASLYNSSAEMRAFFLRASIGCLTSWGILSRVMSVEGLDRVHLDQREVAYSTLTGHSTYLHYLTS